MKCSVEPTTDSLGCKLLRKHKFSYIHTYWWRGWQGWSARRRRRRRTAGRTCWFPGGMRKMWRGWEEVLGRRTCRCQQTGILCTPKLHMYNLCIDYQQLSAIKHSMYSDFHLLCSRWFYYRATAMLSAVYAIVVCPCVCLSHSGIVSKRLNIGSHKQRRTIAPWL